MALECIFYEDPFRERESARAGLGFYVMGELEGESVEILDFLWAFGCIKGYLRPLISCY